MNRVLKSKFFGGGSVTSAINRLDLMVTLRDLTRDNWVECIRLALHDNQRGHLASNVETIAESNFEEHHRLRAIYLRDRLVGLLASLGHV